MHMKYLSDVSVFFSRCFFSFFKRLLKKLVYLSFLVVVASGYSLTCSFWILSPFSFSTQQYLVCDHIPRQTWKIEEMLSNLLSWEL